MASTAYFSMEIGLESDIPTYSGGLGVLAGDTLKSASDVEAPMVGVTLLYRKGYFRQTLDEKGDQQEEPVTWEPAERLKPMEPIVSLELEGRPVKVRAWKYDIIGQGGFIVPIYFLDTDLEENDPKDRELTHFLYGGDERYRLRQEALLGIGGVRMLRALGYDDLRKFHMNEGHAALLTVELLAEFRKETGNETEALKNVRSHCVFTTHTPVPAGHDQFGFDLVDKVLGTETASRLRVQLDVQDKLNMTYLALKSSGYVNGVAEKHREVSQQMFPQFEIQAITNGVHPGTWTSKPFQELYDKHIRGWREDPFSLRHALMISNREIEAAHRKSKGLMVNVLERMGYPKLDPEIFTVGFARRATAYKRATLLFHDIDRLKRIARETGPIQFLFAGKAHPKDEGGKKLIREIVEAGRKLGPEITLHYIQGYNMELGRLLTSGVDLWLNNPLPPLEASGTSGMKAALNGIPSLSVLDGWWLEGHLEGITGWSIGPRERGIYQKGSDEEDANSLYEKLEKEILPLYYRGRAKWVEVMAHAIALNGSFFHTHRMLLEYTLNAYWERKPGVLT